MRRTIRLLPLLLLVAVTTSLNAADENGAMEFDRYYMVFLYRGDHPPQLDEKAAQDLQAQHLRHLESLWEDGYALIAGPFGGGANEPLRGIVLFRGDLEATKVRELAEADPAVKAGRLKVKVLPWFTGAGYLAFPKSPESVGESR